MKQLLLHYQSVILFYYLVFNWSGHFANGSEFDSGSDGCKRNDTNQTCYKRKNNLCFGTNLTYSGSTSELVDLHKTPHQLQNDLSRWEVFKRSPKCWTVLQPLLCATFMPKCEDGLIELPSQELCKVARSHCRLIVEQVMEVWPEFLKCDNLTQYPPNCKNAGIRDQNFTTSAECMDPMIPVNDSTSYYEGFDGCGLKCQDPMFTTEEHASMNTWIRCGSHFLFIVTTFIMCTYCLDWNSSKGTPSEIIFYAILCFAVANLGWILQFWSNAKTDLVCRRDGTIQRNEVEQNVFCVIIFTLIYFGALTSMGWLAVFAFVWNLTCNAAGVIRARVENQATYFHCLIWIISAFLTILSVSLGKGDGNSMSGVCFISYKNPVARLGLVVVPIFLTSLVTFFYLTKGLYRLHVIQKSSKLIPASGKKHLRAHFRRAFIFTFLAVVVIVCFVATEILQIMGWPFWNLSLREFLICKMRLSDVDVDDCRMIQRPSFGLIGLNTFLFFAGGFLVCSWAFTRETIDTWRRILSRFSGSSSNNQRSRHRVRKDQLIAQAYEKKKRLSIPRNGSLSLTLQSIHGDPIGLNRLLDPNQLFKESDSRINGTDDGEEVSSEWVAALPHLLERRNALTVPTSEDAAAIAELGNGRRPSNASNSELDQPKKRFKLSKLKEKLGTGRGFGRKGQRGSVTSFESSDVGSKQYQSSNSELDRTAPKSSGLSKIKDQLGRRNGIGWRARFGSITSLDSNGTAIVLPRMSSKKPRLRTLVVKESCMQTSIENVSFLSPNRRMVDKEMQTSLQSVNQKEIGTQTRKSATKKQKKRLQEDSETQGINENELPSTSNPSKQGYNPVLQLLTPE